MIRLALLRHGATAWNRVGRIQGRVDLPLAAGSAARLRRQSLPSGYAGFAVSCSPLRRARETAAALALDSMAVEPRLVEMDWGRYAGRTRAELVRHWPVEFAANEARGLDFRPVDGESPRMVQQRLLPWLHEVAGAGRDTLAITHKAVIRALLALAHDWNMIGKPPVRLDWTCLHELAMTPGGEVRPGQYNVPLLSRQR